MDGEERRERKEFWKRMEGDGTISTSHWNGDRGEEGNGGRKWEQNSDIGKDEEGTCRRKEGKRRREEWKGSREAEERGRRER